MVSLRISKNFEKLLISGRDRPNEFRSKLLVTDFVVLDNTFYMVFTLSKSVHKYTVAARSNLTRDLENFATLACRRLHATPEFAARRTA